jgi:hypothetical protein
MKNSAAETPSRFNDADTDGDLEIYTNFGRLHTIKEKKPKEGVIYDANTLFSKHSAVNCTMYIDDNGAISKYNNIDVYLQGTSSLDYPVKNY